jgi:hypothetical protein
MMTILIMLAVFTLVFTLAFIALDLFTRPRGRNTPMRVTLDPITDGATVTINDRTHAFRPDRLKVSRTESTDKDGRKYRYLVLTVTLDDEFPETTDHITKAVDR